MKSITLHIFVPQKRSNASGGGDTATPQRYTVWKATAHPPVALKSTRSRHGTQEAADDPTDETDRSFASSDITTTAMAPPISRREPVHESHRHFGN
jgi:hypothetical protein